MVFQVRRAARLQEADDAPAQACQELIPAAWRR